MERIDPIKELKERIRKYRSDTYDWYKRDLQRKRPNRKRGRDLYHGILAYRRRVGQREDRLSFRGVARLYNHLRFEAIQQNPALLDKLPDLYMRFLMLRFPPYQCEKQLYSLPKPLAKYKRDILSCDMNTIRIKIPPTPLMAFDL